MNKRWLQALVITAATVVGCLVLLPLYAQNDLSLEIHEPCANQIVQGPRMTISITFRSADNTNVTRADVLLDGQIIFGGPFNKLMPAGSFIDNRCDIAKANPTAGQHKITIRLTDALGRTCERSTTIMYQPYTRPNIDRLEKVAPLVRITEPKNNAIIESPTKVRAEAADNSGLKLLQIFIDGKPRGLTNSDVYEFIWDPIAEKFISGKYEITASAWDIFDNRGDSDPVLVYVRNSFLPEGGNMTRASILDPLPTENVMDALPVVKPMNVMAGAVTLPAAVPAHRGFLPNWYGGSNTIMPEVLAAQPKWYTPPTAMIGIATARTDPKHPSRDLVSGPALAWGAWGESAVTGRAQSLAPQPALIGPKPTASIRVPVTSGTIELPSVAFDIDDARVIALVPGVGTTLPTIEKHLPVAQEATIPATHEERTGQVALLQPSIVHDPAPVISSAPARAVPVQAPTIVALPAIPDNNRAVPQNLPAGGVVSAAVGALKPAPATSTARPFANAPQTQLVPDRGVGMPVLSKSTDTNRPQVIAAVPKVAQSLPKPATAPNLPRPEVRIAKVGPTVSSPVVKTPPPPIQNANPLPLLRGRAPRITLDDNPLNPAPRAYVDRKGYIMVPMRSLVEAKGGVIMWFPNTREVTAWVENGTLKVKIGARTAHINSAVVIMPSAATLRESRTIVPVNFLMKGLNLQATYDKAKNSLALTSQ